MAKKFEIKIKDSLIDKIGLFFGGIFSKKPKLVNLNEHEIEKRCILLGLHNGSNKPANLRAFLDKRYMTWQPHAISESFKSRRNYLYHIVYRGKLKYSKPKSAILSIFWATFARLRFFYRGTIPVYYDSRVYSTHEYSLNCLNNDVSVVIFPEDSSKGFKQPIERLWPGFIYLARFYFRKTNLDLPVYPMFFDRKSNTLTIGKPMHINRLLEFRNDDEVLEIFQNYLNAGSKTSNKFHIKTEPAVKPKSNSDEDSQTNSQK